MTTLQPKTEFRPTKALANPTARGTRLVVLPAPAPGSLIDAIRDAVGAVPEPDLVRVAPADSGLAHQPRILLAMLGYCYAHGIYGSEEIEDALRRDSTFRWICGNEFPHARLIRKFRRANREVLQRVLQAGLMFIAGRSAPGAGPDFPDVPSLSEEASRRMMCAVFIDSVELDGDAAD